MEGQGSIGRRFLVDGMLGKLARWLRMLGFDAPCHPLSAADLAACEEEGRIAVTRNRRWCRHRRVLCLTANAPSEQLREILLQLAIQPDEIDFLSRCAVCNRRLETVPRQEVQGLVPDYVFETTQEFSRCAGCGRIYWYGSHPERMLERFRNLVAGTKLEGWAP